MTSFSFGTEFRAAQTDEIDEIIKWSPDLIESVTSSEPDNQLAVKGLMDGSAKTVTKMQKLKGSSLTIRFKKPQAIGRLGIQAGGWNNWSQPKDIAVSGDGKEICTSRLEQINTAKDVAKSRRIQSVPLNCTVSELTIHVTDVYPGAVPLGGFAEIGEAQYGASEYSFTEEPMRNGHQSVKLVIQAPSDTTVQLSAKLDKMKFLSKPFQVTAGQKEYDISLTSLSPAEEYGFQLNPANLDTIQIQAIRHDVPVRIIKVTPEPESVSTDSWIPLPKIDFPTKMIDGKLWREGLSYRTAGRFGNSAYNGLLTETLSDSWFRVYTANGDDIYRRHDFDFNINGLAQSDSGREGKPWRLNLADQTRGKKTSINWTTMIRTLPLDGGGEVTYHAGILVPGFLIDSDRQIMLSSRGGGKLPERSGAPDEGEGRFYREGNNGEQKQIGPAAIITSHGVLNKPGKITELSEPWIVAIWGLPSNKPTFWGDRAVAVLLTSDAKGPIEWTSKGLNLPAGRWGVSSAFSGLLPQGWQQDNVISRARLLTRMLRNYPVDCREFYTIENDKVRIRNEFSYVRWGNKNWQSEDYAPIPPIYSWARDSVNWSGVPLGSVDIKTPFGPYRWVSGNALEYSLPNIQTDHAAYPRRPEYEAHYRGMEEEIQQRFATADPFATLHPWIIAYRERWTQTLMGAGYYRPEIRDMVTSISRPYAERLYASSSWIYREELFSKTPYYLKGWQDMTARPVMFGDPNSNIGQAAYSIYAYAKYTGDWDLIRRNWPRIMDTIRFFEVVNDWAVPETSSREATKYGAIDMDTIAFCGVAAMQRMAEVLGQKEDLERITYLKAKISASTALRFNINRYLDPQSPDLFCAGFAEDGPHLEHARPGTAVGRDHIAMCLTWTGETPEMFDFYLKLLSPEFLKQFQLNLMDKYFSDWRTMPHNKVRSAAHITCRARISDWPMDQLTDDLSIWLKHIEKNATPIEASGMFGAYTAHETGIYVVNWEPAKYVSGIYNQSSRQLDVILDCNQPFTVEFISALPAATVSLDGRIISSNDISRNQNRTAVKLSHGGRLHVQFATQADAKK